MKIKELFFINEKPFYFTIKQQITAIGKFHLKLPLGKTQKIYIDNFYLSNSFPKLKKSVISITVEEKKAIEKINKAFDKYGIKSISFLKTIGNIKGKFHNKDFDCSYLIDQLEAIGIKWNKIRDINRMKAYREKHPICEKCNNFPSEHTHHLISPINDGKEIEENYIAVCIPCHELLHPELPKGFLSSKKGYKIRF